MKQLRKGKKKAPTPTEAREILARSRADPIWFCREVLGDRHIWEKQQEILLSVRDNAETAAKGCHSFGKSWIAARAALWFLYSHKPSMVITTAPTQRQVEGILWKEIRAAHARAKFPLGGTPLQTQIKLAENWFAWGFTATDPDKFQGFHEISILLIVDESAGVLESIYEAIDSVLTTEHARLLLIGNPTSSSGRFLEDFKTPGVAKISVSAYDTPNFTEFGITRDDIRTGTWEEKLRGKVLPYPYLTTPQWVAGRLKRWGENSPRYQARVEGQFPPFSTDALVPLAWIEAAIDREIETGGPAEFGVDIARFGDDESVIALRNGMQAQILDALPMADTMETAGWVARYAREKKPLGIKIDTIGVGGGVHDRLKEQNYPVQEVNVSSSPRNKEDFLNLRAEAYWTLREIFEKGEVSLIGDPELLDILAGQLAAIKYKIDSRGRIQIESKDEMKKRGHPSPDYADALMLSFVPRRERKKGARVLSSRRKGT